MFQFQKGRFTMNSSAATLSSLALSAIAGAFASGCGSPATYKDSRGNDLVVSLDKVNVQDFNQAADKLVQSMATSGVLANAPRKPAVLGISRVVNDTSDQFDTDQLLKRIRVALLQTGKVQVSTTVGLGGRAEDPMAKGTKDMNDFVSGKGSAVPDNLPDYTLTAKILENRASAGSTKQVTYTFQMSLTDVRSGNAVWEGNEEITKQGSKSSLGF